MSLSVVNLTNLPRINQAKIALLGSKWHSKYVLCMMEKCQSLLKERGAEVWTHIVPGTFEFPYAAQHLKVQFSELEAIVCLSVVLKGETQHFEMILDACSRGLTQVALEQEIVIINGILPATDMQQVKDRANDDDRNKGIEVAIATIEMVDWVRSTRDSVLTV